MTFCILPGTYKIDKSSIHCKAAIANNYFDVMNAVRKKQNVEEFIIKNGGKCVMDEQIATHIIGGRLEDSRVQSISKCLQRLQTKFADGKIHMKAKLAKKEESELKLSTMKVLNWVYIYRVVNEMKVSKKRSVEIKSHACEQAKRGGRALIATFLVASLRSSSLRSSNH